VQFRELDSVRGNGRCPQRGKSTLCQVLCDEESEEYRAGGKCVLSVRCGG